MGCFGHGLERLRLLINFALVISIATRSALGAELSRQGPAGCGALSIRASVRAKESPKNEKHFVPGQGRMAHPRMLRMVGPRLALWDTMSVKQPGKPQGIPAAAPAEIVNDA